MSTIGKSTNYWTVCSGWQLKGTHKLSTTGPFVTGSHRSQVGSPNNRASYAYGDVIKWKHFRRHWPFVRGIHRSLVNFPHKGQWRGALMFSLICAWTNAWANNQGAGDMRPHCACYDVTVMEAVFMPWLHNLHQGCFLLVEVEVWEWISYFIPQFILDAITYPFWVKVQSC